MRIKNKSMQTKQRIMITATALIVACALIFTFVWFSRRLHSLISETNNSFLKETSSHQAALFHTKLNDQLSVLESLAKQFTDVDFSDYNELKKAVFALHGIGDFKQMTVANAQGACISNNNTYSANISKKHYFQAALNGEATVSNGIDVNAEGDDILALSVPIYQKNNIVGVLTGIYDRSVLDSLFSATLFNGEGYTYIINSTGDIMVKTDNANSLVKGSNFLSFLEDVTILDDENSTSYDEVVEDLGIGNANTIHYKIGSQERYSSYYPVGVHDWYVVSTITGEIILSQTQDISFIIIILVSILAVILLGVFMIILSTVQKAEMAIIKNERYRLVSAQNQSVIFDYDVKQKILDLSGGTEFVFGEDYPSNAPIDLEALRANIHHDDTSTFEKFLQACKANEIYNAFEFRYKCADDNYYWFRLSSTLVKNNDKPLKIVGNIVNVESQKNQELSLKHKAEHDPLTGLLNKVAMENCVETFLKTQEADSIHALFIIDLDNFKAVNDTLGHVFGDKVLVDTASKLARVFSEKDFIGRIGGDEFSAFLNLSAFDNIENAKRIIVQKGNSLRKSLHETYKGQDDKEVTVSASIGIALYSQDGYHYQTLYNNADKALYVSKENGKNSFHFYQKE